MNSTLKPSANLRRIFELAENSREFNDYFHITEELIFWAFSFSDCSPFFWMAENCGSTDFYKFLSGILPHDFEEPKFDDGFIPEEDSLIGKLCDSAVLTDLKNGSRIASMIGDDSITPECFIYASFLRRQSLIGKFFNKFCPVSNGSKRILKDYILYDSMRGQTNTQEVLENLEESILNQLFQDAAPFSQQSSKPKSFLEKYCRNLNKEAELGKIDNVIGRERETDAVITVLCRKNKNNPVLVGEAGVGKTAIAENLAAKIVNQGCNPLLWDKNVYELKMSSIVSDATLRGQFEERLEGIIKEACKFSNVILYIDELHTLVGAGSGMNSPLDASNMLKPYLARGDLMLLGSTTTEEYRQHIRGDKALDRRFQKIVVQEPTKEECVEILTGIVNDYEEYHNVTFPINLISKVVDLSDKFVPNKNFPDKAIDILDETCSFVKTSHWEYPEELVSINNNLNNLSDSEMEKEIDKIMTDYDTVIGDWADKVTTVPTVSEDDVYDLFYQKFNISKLLLNRGGRGGLSFLEESLGKKTFGQSDAIKVISSYIKRKYIGLEASNDGSMFSILFTGPSGCGKEFLSRQLSKELFSGPDNFFYFNCDSLNLESINEACNRGVFCTLYFDNFDPSDQSYNKFFETMISEGYSLNKFGERVWCKHCCIILSASADTSNKADIGFNDTSSGKRLLCPYVDKIIELSKIEKDILKKVAVDKACEILEKITCKFGNIEVKYTRDVVGDSIINFLGDKLVLDTLDGEISDFLSDRLCDSLVDLSSKGGSLNVDEVLLNLQNK